MVKNESMKKISKIILVVTLLLLGCGLFCKKTAELVKLGKKIEIIKLIQGREEEKVLVKLVNKEREKQGLKRLSNESELELIAGLRAEEILGSGGWSHENIEGKRVGDKARERKYDYKIIGENLAKNYGSEEETIRAWMNSEEHRRNLLREEYSKVGVAEVKKEGVNLKVLVLAD